MSAIVTPRQVASVIVQEFAAELIVAIEAGGDFQNERSALRDALDRLDDLA